jgi:hypothetical protein
MLGAAERLCLSVLGDRRTLPAGVAVNSPAPYLMTGTGTPFAKGRGHYELWESLCTHNNEPVVQVFRPGDFFQTGTYRARDDLGNWAYPLDHPVGNQRGEVEIGVQPSNSMPWCISAKTEAEIAEVESWAERFGLSPDYLPICPLNLFSEALGQEVYRLELSSSGPESPLGNHEFVDRWVRQGAINAGLSAYYYIRGLTHHELTPSRSFDFCRD